ncbi:MAG: vitamin K epoxide reductase family protein [Gemmatimonadota bacterium]
MRRARRFGVSTAAALGLVLASTARAEPLLAQLRQEPVVHAVLFYSPACPHCHKVMTQDLPPLAERYGDRLVMVGVDVTSSGGQELYRATADYFGIPEPEQGVPMLVVGSEVLMGSLEIPERFPGIIEAGLAGGGLDWPAVPLVRTALAQQGMLEEAPEEQGAPPPTASGQATDAPPETRTAPEPGADRGVVAETRPPAEPDAQPASEPGTQPASEPGKRRPAEVEAKPAAEPEAEPPGESEPEPSAEPEPESVPGSRPATATVEEADAHAQPLPEAGAAPGDGASPGPEARPAPEPGSGAEPMTGAAAERAPDALPQDVVATPLGASMPRALSVADRLRLDPTGNGMAVAVLLLLVLLVVTVTRHLLVPLPRIFVPRTHLIPLLCILGTGVAAYLAWIEVTGALAVCGPVGDCNTVQQSPYARLFGVVPVALLGLAGYAAMAGTWILARYVGARWRAVALWALWGMALVATVFSIYLTFLEPFVIGATCAWCVTSSLVSGALLLLATGEVRPSALPPAAPPPTVASAL